MSLAQVASSHGTHHQGSGLRQIWEQIFTQYSTDMWELEPVIRRSERSATQSNRPGPSGAAAMAIGRPAGLGVMVPVPRNEPFAMRQMTVGNVRHGSKAAAARSGCDVRFAPESGHPFDGRIVPWYEASTFQILPSNVSCQPKYCAAHRIG